MKALFLISFLFSLSATAQVLELGETHSFPLRGQSQIWIQDRKVLSGEAAGGSLRVRALKEGTSRVRIGQQSYQVQVVGSEKTQALTVLNKKLKNFVGLKAQIQKGKLILTGNLYRWKDWEHLAEVLKEQDVTYSMQAHLSENVRLETQRQFNLLLEKTKLPPQTLILDPEPEIRVKASDLNVARYERLLRPYGVQVVRDEGSLELAPTIKVSITVAEIKRSEALRYGIKWPSAYTATVLPEGGIQKSPAEWTLHAMEDEGHGRILASPNLICRSGKEAEFLAGGEFPIKMMNYKAQDVVWKRYGILLRVKPRADAAGRLSISLETEVSTLDQATAVEGIPGILTNRVSSHFDLSEPRTIALSGLLKNEDGHRSEGLPMLSKIPVLGALFSSKDYRDNKSELVIFVRPSILKESDPDESPAHLQTGRTEL